MPDRHARPRCAIDCDSCGARQRLQRDLQSLQKLARTVSRASEYNVFVNQHVRCCSLVFSSAPVSSDRYQVLPHDIREGGRGRRDRLKRFSFFERSTSIFETVNIKTASCNPERLRIVEKLDCSHILPFLGDIREEKRSEDSMHRHCFEKWLVYI